MAGDGGAQRLEPELLGAFDRFRHGGAAHLELGRDLLMREAVLHVEAPRALRGVEALERLLPEVDTGHQSCVAVWPVNRSYRSTIVWQCWGSNSIPKHRTPFCSAAMN